LFDIKKAFDSVNHNILLEKLKIVLKDDFDTYCLFAWILSSVSFKINELSQVIYLNNGVPQGFSSSPFFFNEYINDLLECLKRIGKDIIVFAFADDLAIICYSVKELELIIKVTLHWCSLNKLEINFDKSKILYYNKNYRGRRPKQ